MGQEPAAAAKARVLAVQATIAVAFFAFILFTSNPFAAARRTRRFDGNDLNPLLQDPGLAFHPPFLYLGYVGLSMAYSFAIAALIEGRVDAAWARWVRPWTLLAWIFLTIGIAFGSIWAYYELGWGGWWFWDPVENVCFMPWLISAALLHSAIVVEKRDTLKSWTILLAILAFSFSLIGAFIVRSGVLTSVHAFANDPERGVFLLLILGAFIGGSLTLYAWRAPMLRSDAVFATVSRESGLVVNNLLLVVATFVVFIGTIWPLLVEVLTGRKVSVGAPFFDLAFTPFIVALAVVLPVLRDPALEARQPRAAPSASSAAPLALAAGARRARLGDADRPLDAGAGRGRARGLADPRRPRRDRRRGSGSFEAGAGEALRRARNLPRADWGKALAHAGLGVTIFGVAAITAWAQRGHPRRPARRGLRLRRLRAAARRRRARPRPELRRRHRHGDRPARRRAVATLHPEKRVYDVQGMATTEAAIDRGLTRDLYVALGEPQDGGWALRSYLKPFANWIWLGALVMALGGVVSLTDRRYRVGAPARRARRPRRCPRNEMRRSSPSSLCLLPLAAAAVQPDEILADPAQEARARAITKELRCVVCQSESIDDSNADIARDLRLLVRERITAGDSDDQVRDYVVDRYGEFVLFRPPLNALNAVLWFSGPALLLLGGGVAFGFIRRRATARAPERTPLSAEEEARVRDLTGG